MARGKDISERKYVISKCQVMCPSLIRELNSKGYVPLEGRVNRDINEGVEILKGFDFGLIKTIRR